MKSSPHLSAAFLLALALLLDYGSVDAFSPSSSSYCIGSQYYRPTNKAITVSNNLHGRGNGIERTTTVLFESSNDDDAKEDSSAIIADMTELQASQTRETPKLTPDDKSFVSSIYVACDNGGNIEAMENTLTANLDTMSPSLVVALQIAGDKQEWKEEADADEADDDAGNSAELFESQMVALGTALQNVLNIRLRSGREMLATLLNSGEIRKLDSTIGKAAKEGKLDMSFFSVLSMNMKDAAMMEEGGSASLSPTLAQGEGQEAIEGSEGQPMGANRLQILQHIYTRCQEELEKNVAPGIGLLNKLLRTDISSIRTNQLQHYLGPQVTSITSPDGKVIELPNSNAKPLVSHSEFIDALSNAVTQIRTLEAAGGTDRLSAMNLIENIRQVAMEAREVLVMSFGEESEIVLEFQKDLQPVFRPGSKV